MTEYEQEQQYLERVKRCIEVERKELEENLEKAPWEYKGRYSDVKWGDEDLVDDLTTMYTTRLKKIKNLEKKPYFGSFNFTQQGYNQMTFRIGKTDVLERKNSLVLDWRNPICTLYYDQSTGTVSYEAPYETIVGKLSSKKQILIEDGQIQSIKEVDLVSDDELLQPYLDINADNRMKTIIASIQSEQNAIIRKPIHKNLIVQGVAGSGKTSVALHRIAFLLYNKNDKYFDASKFIIIGPNKYFLNYISSILPDLDTQKVTEYTIEEIAKEIIEEPKYLYETAYEALNRSLKKPKIKSISSIKGTLEYKQSLTKFLEDYFLTSISNGIMFENIEIISKEELRVGLKIKENYTSLINNIIKVHIKNIKAAADDKYYQMVRPMMEEMKKYPLRTPERAAVIARMDELKRMMKKGCATELKQLYKPLFLNPIQLYKLFLENIDKYMELTEEEIRVIKDESLKMLKKKIIPYEDLAAICYLSILYKGTSYYKKYQHIVIDEAQDYDIFQFDILKKIFNSATFSIFGDLAQSIYSYRTISSWEDIKSQIFDNNCEILEMVKSYRTTKEITYAANYILNKLNLSESTPVIRTGPNIEIDEVINNETSEKYYLSKISEFIDKKYKSIGIICKNEEETIEVKEMLEKLQVPFNYVTSSDKTYNGGISILTSHLAKGLEFDAVIINNASEKKYNSNSKTDMHLLYVSMTRALHELHILYEEELTNVLESIKKPQSKENPKKLIKKK